MKNIIIVADDKIKKSGRKFVHILSKSENIKAILYSPKMYENNENQITGNNYFIFLGKNKVSQDYISIITSWKKNKGVCWGYDNKKAMIYIENSDFSEEEIIKEIKRAQKSLIASGLWGIPWVVFFPSLLPFDLFKVIVKINEKKKIIQEKQFDIGMLNFIEQDLESYIK